jgi:hypothetical protein
VAKSVKSAKSDGKTYDNANRGVLFVNDKEGNDARPDWTGRITIRSEDFEVNDDGLVEARLAAWFKESKQGNQFLSIRVSPYPKD